jgi:hypothetical protein
MRIMQRVTLVRYATKPDRAVENETLSRAVFKELHATAPDGVAYALFRHGAEFTHLFVNLRDESADVLTELPTFKAFAQDSADRYQAPPTVERLALKLVDSYGFTKAMATA